MATRLDLAAMLDGVGDFATKKRKAAEAQVAATRENLVRTERQLRTQAAAAALSLARNPNTPPGVAQQALRVAAEVSPKKAPTPKKAPPSKAAPLQSGGSGAQPAAETAFAALKAAQSTIFLGQDDKLIAGAQTLLGAGGKGGVVERYARNLARQAEFSRTVAEAHPVASSLGGAVGLAPALATAAPTAVARAVAPRFLNSLRGGRELGEIARIQNTPRELISLIGGSGVTSVGAQALADGLGGQRSSPTDLAGALVGGAVAGPLTKVAGATAGAAGEGLVTSMAQDAFAGRPVSLLDGMKTASAGARLGSLGERAGTRYIKRLPPHPKGRAGEALSIAKRIADWDQPNFTHKTLKLSRGHTFLDPASSRRLYVETKTGERPSISAGQLRARREFPDRYQVDWWHENDFGKLFGHLTGVAGAHLNDQNGTRNADSALNGGRYGAP